MNATRWPLYIPSKGRYSKDTALTVAALRRDLVPFFIMVEPQEAEHYERLIHGSLGEMLVLPFSDLGLGSIPARNFGRDHAEEHGHARHWSLDDNCIEFRRLWKGQRIPCDAGAALRLVEDFTDRFSNVGVSGLAYQMFVTSETPRPFYRNVHVYSASLVNHAMPYRWRGRYNEDTDLCLQGLANGWATILVTACMVNKLKTMASAGGNAAIYDMDAENEEAENHTDTDGRYHMARALEKLWPGVVRVSSRFGRYQHHVNWGKYERVKLKLREDFDYDALPEVDERDFRFRAVTRPKSPQLRELLASFEEEAAATSAPELWRGMPAFAPVGEPPKIKYVFKTVAEQDAVVKELNVVIAKRTGPALSAWYPRRDRQDLASLRFDSTRRSTAPPIVDMPEEEVAEIGLAIEEAHAEQFVGEPVVADGEQIGVVVDAEFVPSPLAKLLAAQDAEPEEELTEEEAEIAARAEEELGDVPRAEPTIMRPTFGSPPRPSSYDVYD